MAMQSTPPVQGSTSSKNGRSAFLFPELLTGEAAFNAHLAAAEALPDDAVLPYPGGIEVVRKNVEHALDALKPHMERVLKELPTLTAVGLWATADLAAATEHAVMQVSDPATLGASYEDKLKRLRELRDLMLGQAELLAKMDKLPSGDVKKIRENTGDYDQARDGVQLAKLYRDHAADIQGMHPFTDDEIAEIDKLGHELMKVITPTGARAPRDHARDASVELRNRFWTLLTRAYPDLRRAGFWVFLDEVDRHVPKLASRLIARGARETPPKDPPTDPQPQ